MVEEAVKLSVSNDIVERIVRSEITAAVLRGLSVKEDQIITELVEQVLNLKVNREGKVGSSYENNQTFLQYIVGNAIRTQAQTALQEWVKKNESKVKKAVESSLAKRMSAIANDYVRAFSEAAADKYRFTMTLHTEEGYKEYASLRDELAIFKKQIEELTHKQ